MSRYDRPWRPPGGRKAVPPPFYKTPTIQERQQRAQSWQNWEDSQVTTYEDLMDRDTARLTDHDLIAAQEEEKELQLLRKNQKAKLTKESRKPDRMGKRWKRRGDKGHPA